MEGAMERKMVFLRLSIVGVLIGVALAVWAALGSSDGAARGVLALLVLLNARQNLRQYRYVGVLEALLQRSQTPAEP